MLTGRDGAHTLVEMALRRTAPFTPGVGILGSVLVLVASLLTVGLPVSVNVCKLWRIMDVFSVTVTRSDSMVMMMN